MMIGIAMIFGEISAQSLQTAASRDGWNPNPTWGMERNATWLTWATVMPSYHMLGFNDEIQYYAMQRFTTSDLAPYNGLQLTKVSFLPSTHSDEPTIASYTIVVYTGGYVSGSTYSAGSLARSQALASSSLEMGEWNTITLSSPLTINSSQELWIGVYVNATQGYAMSYDDATSVAGKGNIMGLDGSWGQASDFLSSVSITNWNIAGCVSDGLEDQYIDLSVQFINNGSSQTSITQLTVPAGSPLRSTLRVRNERTYAANMDYTDTTFLTSTLDGQPLSSHLLHSDTLLADHGVWLNVNDLTPQEIFDLGYCGTVRNFCYRVTPNTGWLDADTTNNVSCVSVNFQDYEQYFHITVLNDDGTVSPDSVVTVRPGGMQRFVLTPPDSLVISRVLVDGEEATENVTYLLGTGWTYVFRNVQADHTLQVFYGVDTTRVEDYADPEVRIYPNPTKDQIFFQSHSAVSDVVIYDLSGKVASSFNSCEFQGTLPVSSLSPGIYFIRFNTANGIVNQKFIKY